MAKGTCPDCEQLVTIVPTGKPRGNTGTARWWRVAYHPMTIEHSGTIAIETQCTGVDKLI